MDICHQYPGRHTSVHFCLPPAGAARTFLAVRWFSPFFPLWESKLLLLWVKWWVQLFGKTHKGNWENWWISPTFPPKKKMGGKLCTSPAKADFISHVYVTINIYKEHKIAGKTGWSTVRFGSINTLMTGRSSFFILVLGSGKKLRGNHKWHISRAVFFITCQ